MIPDRGFLLTQRQRSELEIEIVIPVLGKGRDPSLDFHGPLGIKIRIRLFWLPEKIKRQNKEDRWNKGKFGAEYDSMSDLVSFGVAPALVVFSWALGDLGKFGWSVAFIYLACAALRLARFNTQIETTDSNYFTGLPSPSAAAIIASTVWVCNDLGWVGSELPYELSVLVGLLTATVGFLMIANFPYYSFKDLDFRGRVPFVVIILVVLAFGLVTLDPPSVFLVVFLIYAASGPFMKLVRRRGEH